VHIVARATDESYNTQPQRPEEVWNLRGVACNSWAHATVE
jgi:sulfite oxidase